MTKIINIIISVLYLVAVAMFYNHILNYYETLFYSRFIRVDVLLFDALTFPVTLSVLLFVILLVVNLIFLFRHGKSKQSVHTAVNQQHTFAEPVRSGVQSFSGQPSGVSEPQQQFDENPIYYFVSEGQQYGPVSIKDVASLVAQGIIDPGTLFWKQGQENWLPASDINDVCIVFQKNM